MDKLTPELHRILLKRITKALRKARYEPAAVMDEEAAAAEVLRPYAAEIVSDDAWREANAMAACFNATAWYPWNERNRAKAFIGLTQEEVRLADLAVARLFDPTEQAPL